ncbi:hypothetical protein JXA48_00315 [Candidatus Woesearchaeota archaeon]|nr:hypothetical protein [Candidatus Woesearchaeota archaeon]
MSSKKEEDVQKVNLGLLRDETEEEIKYIQKKLQIEDKEVYLLSKQFFKKLLELDYETTYEELLEEIDKIYLDKELRKEIQAFIINIGQIEYSRKEFTQEELRILLDELRRISKKLIHIHQQKGFFARLLIKLGAKEESEETTVGSLKEIVEKEEDKLEEQVKISNLRDSLIASEKAMDEEHNEEKAKKLYQKAMQLYSELSKEQQNFIYPELMKTYNHLS